MPPAATTLRLNVPSDTRYLHLITGMAREVASAAGFAGREADQVGLAIDEAVTNVIEHAYRGDPGHRIELVFELHGDGIAIRVIHEGEPIAEDRIPPYDPEEHVRRGRRGGLGLVLMRRLMDSVEFGPTEDRRSQCRLQKLAPRAAAAERSEGSVPP